MKVEINKLKEGILPQFDLVKNRYDNKEENSFYYKWYVLEWKKEWVKDLNSHPNYDPVDKGIIIDFIKQQALLILNTTKLFTFVHRYKEPNPGLPVKIAITQADVIEGLNAMEYYENQLKHRVRQKEYSLSLDIQYDLLLIFQESLSILKANCQIDVNKSPLGAYFKEARKKLKKAVDKKEIDLLIRTQDEKEIKARAINLPKNKDYEKSFWFKVGLKFATGEIKKYPYPEYSAPNIAEALELPGGEKWILGTINEYKTDKDVYASRMKMQKIIDYCRENNIPVDPDFSSKIPPE